MNPRRIGFENPQDLSAFDEGEKAQLRELARKAITGRGDADPLPSKILPELTEEAQ